MTRGYYPPGAVSDDDDEQHLDSSQQGSVREHRLALGDKITLQLWRQESYLEWRIFGQVTVLGKGGLLALPQHPVPLLPQASQ